MSNKLLKTLKSIGWSEKAALVYLACLDLGQASVQQLAKHSGIVRTTIYYILEELIELGAIIETKRDKKIYYVPENPQVVLRQIKNNVHDLEQAVPQLESRLHSAFGRPKIFFMHGSMGFKQMWNKILDSKTKSFDIITSAETFTNFVSEKYIVENIIQTKKNFSIKSRQLIADSQAARKIVAKDSKESRTSKLLPPAYRLPSTIVICQNFVAFISPRHEDLLFIVDSESVVKTHQAMFNALWDSIK